MTGWGVAGRAGRLETWVMETTPPSPASFGRRKFIVGAASAASLPVLFPRWLPVVKARPIAEAPECVAEDDFSLVPLPLDFDAALDAMKRWLPPPPYDTNFSALKTRGRTQTADANPRLSELLGIFLACSKNPEVFGFKYRPVSSDVVFLFFTSGRIRRLLAAARKPGGDRAIRRGLQVQLSKTAPSCGPAWAAGLWGPHVGWFKLKILECFFDPRPYQLWWHEPVSLETLLMKRLLDEEITSTT